MPTIKIHEYCNLKHVFKLLCFGFYLNCTELIWPYCVKQPTKLGRIRDGVGQELRGNFVKGLILNNSLDELMVCSIPLNRWWDVLYMSEVGTTILWRGWLTSVFAFSTLAIFYITIMSLNMIDLWLYIFLLVSLLKRMYKL